MHCLSPPLRLAAVAFLVGIAGCGEPTPAPIQSYTVKRLPATHRIDAAIVMGADQAWFFKRTIDLEQLPEPDSKFTEWVAALTWPEGEPRPVWTTPDGWKQRTHQDRMIDFAMETGVDGEQVTMTRLPLRDETPRDEYLLMNVNRWRRQLELPAWDIQQMQDGASPLGSAEGLTVSLTGRLPRRAETAPPSSPSPSPSDEPEPPPIKFATPDGWTPAPRTMFAQVALQAGPDEKSVKITVSAAGGELAANVNRWRGQLGLEPWTATQIDESAKATPVATLDGKGFEFENEGQAIYAVVAADPEAGVSWFIKLSGNAETAASQREQFADFVESLELPRP